MPILLRHKKMYNITIICLFIIFITCYILAELSTYYNYHVFVNNLYYVFYSNVCDVYEYDKQVGLRNKLNWIELWKKFEPLWWKKLPAFNHDKNK